jgi:hypothetical protein
MPEDHWRKQIPFGPYFADFCSHSAKLIIEVDGGQHATTGDYDGRRTHFLERQGYGVLRFWNNDVLSNTDGVLQRIADALSMKASPLVGEVGGGRPVSTGQESLLSEQSANAACSAPPPNPPHEGEGLEQRK